MRRNNLTDELFTVIANTRYRYYVSIRDSLLSRDQARIFLRFVSSVSSCVFSSQNEVGINISVR